MATKTAFILCGALAREVMAISRRRGWDVDLVGVPALDHMRPERIAPDVEKRLQELQAQYDRVLVVYGDCGSRGALDETLARYGVERLEGPHCYEMYAGPEYEALMEEEPGTFFLTDFLLRGFYGLVVKGLGLDRYPQLKGDYFGNYRRVVYLVQIPDPALLAKAEQVAAYLELPLQVVETGFGELEERLVKFMSEL
jgi:hypothetical protein